MDQAEWAVSVFAQIGARELWLEPRDDGRNTRGIAEKMAPLPAKPVFFSAN
jgi:hypothetical protein